MSGGAPRREMVESAISFLRESASNGGSSSSSSSSSAPLSQRIAFLESKGLTPAEISHSLHAAVQGSSQQQFVAGMPPLPPPQGASRDQRRYFERDWRDWFIMSVIGGAVGWLGVMLARKYLLPHLQAPTETALEEAERSLALKYDEASALVRSLKDDTDALARGVDESRADVRRELDELRRVAMAVEANDKRREEQQNEMAKQVAGVVESLPKMLDQRSGAQAQSLADLQSELKSLKSLIVTRRTPLPGTSNGAGSAPGSGPSTPPPASPAPGSSAPLFGSGSVPRPGLPAWQLKGSASALAQPQMQQQHSASQPASQSSSTPMSRASSSSSDSALAPANGDTKDKDDSQVVNGVHKEASRDPEGVQNIA